LTVFKRIDITAILYGHVKGFGILSSCVRNLFVFRIIATSRELGILEKEEIRENWEDLERKGTKACVYSSISITRLAVLFIQGCP
jgi:hypothetical protein